MEVNIRISLVISQWRFFICSNHMPSLDPKSDLSSNQTVKVLNPCCNSSLPRLWNAWALGPELSRVSWLASRFQFKEEVQYSWEGLGKLLLIISWLLALSWYQGPGMTGKEDEDFSLTVPHLSCLWALFQQHGWHQKARLWGGIHHKMCVWAGQLGPVPYCRGKISKFIDSLITS